jgi:hypothetical protein
MLPLHRCCFKLDQPFFSILIWFFPGIRALALFIFSACFIVSPSWNGGRGGRRGVRQINELTVARVKHEYVAARRETAAMRALFAIGVGIWRTTMRAVWTAAVVTGVGVFFLCGAAAQQQTQSLILAAKQDYERSVADYRQCIAANPNNASACEDLRHTMISRADIYLRTVRTPTGN